MEILLGLLGGGGLVQLLNLIFTRRATHRQMNAEAMGKEVEALERTIVVIQRSFEQEIARLQREIARLEGEIGRLKAGV